jgi:hypothetical protein
VTSGDLADCLNLGILTRDGQGAARLRSRHRVLLDVGRDHGCAGHAVQDLHCDLAEAAKADDERVPPAAAVLR